MFERETGLRPGEYTGQDFRSWAFRNKDRLQDLVLDWYVGIVASEALEAPDSELVGSWTVGSDGMPERIYRRKK
jgi:hypothetical protein